MTASTSLRAFMDPEAIAAQEAYFVRFLDTMHALPAAQANHRRVVELLAPEPGARILDVGCGPGHFARDLAPLVAPGGCVVGIDQSETFVAVARERSAETGLPVEFRVADAQALPFPDDAFAAARTERVLQYLPAPAQGLAEMIRVTRPGGRIVASEVDWGTAARDQPGIDRGLLRRVARASGDAFGEAWMGRQLRRLFLDAGLEDVTSEGTALVFSDPATPDLLDLYGTWRQHFEHGVITITEDEYQELTAATRAASEADRFFYSITLFTVSGRKPNPR